MSKRDLYTTISPAEIRGREILRIAVEEARIEAERKREMVKPQVQDELHDFLAGTDGIHFSGSSIQVSHRDHKRITQQKKRIEEMEALHFDPELIEFARRELRRDLTYLLSASYRAPKRLEVADHHEKEEKRADNGIWSRLGRFGRKKKEEDVVVEVVEEE
jgi:hypothetical protein